jgi:hypothetical protein
VRKAVRVDAAGADAGWDWDDPRDAANAVTAAAAISPRLDIVIVICGIMTSLKRNRSPDWHRAGFEGFEWLGCADFGPTPASGCGAHRTIIVRWS